MKILLLSRYTRNAASSRYRFYQYIPYLESHEFCVTNHPFFDDSYLKALYSGRKASALNIFKSYLKRLFALLESRRFDLVWVEGEFFPWLPYSVARLLLLTETPYIVDYDDAKFHRYDQHRFKWVRQFLGKNIADVMGNAEAVVVGNNYLFEFAKRAGAKRVEELPTVVDLKRYPPEESPRNSEFTIGWIGTPWTARYLEEIEPVLKEVCEKRDARVVIVGARKDQFNWPTFTVKPWSESTEVQEIQNFDVGIMPLPDLPWERGKCGLKLIQYMACGRPVIGAPVEVNKELILEGVNGFPASTREEWLRALQRLKDNKNLRRKMGLAGRKLVEEKFSLQVALPKLIKIFQSLKK